MRHVRHTLLAASFVLAIAAIPVAAQDRERVVGGTDADPEQWTAAVALADQDGQFCGGTLVDPEWVLTAKHCVAGPPPPGLVAIIGRHDLRIEDGEEREVIETHRRPGVDLALLKLAAPAVPDPLPLATRAQDAAATGRGEEMRVAGWGAKRPRGGGASQVLREARQFGKPARRCRRAFVAFKPRKLICALGRKMGPRQHESSCYGDSGGPLVADLPEGRVLVGAVSGGGFRCGDPKEPAYYSRVAASRAWIRGFLTG